jgi:hypothetical protein
MESAGRPGSRVRQTRGNGILGVRKWAGNDPEPMRLAVSAACLWACDQTIRLHVNLDRKPGNYIRKGLEWALPAAKRDDSLDYWEYPRDGSKRTWVRLNRQTPVSYREDDEGAVLDPPELADPARARYDPDYRRSIIAATTPDVIVDNWPPPDNHRALQLLVAGLLNDYMHNRVDASQDAG